jgi:predicted ATPase
MRRRDHSGHFVNRGHELAVLDAALARAIAGEPSMVVVAGDAGVGKTRLLAEFVAQVGGRVLWGACLPMGERGLPFAPIAKALRALGSDPGLAGRIPAAVAPLVSDGGEPGPALTRSQLFQAILGLVEELAGRATTVLVVEDLHWADQSTRDLLAFLVDRPGSDGGSIYWFPTRVWSACSAA